MVTAQIEPSHRYCITGWPDAVESRLRRKVGALSRHGAFHKKIGITNNPAVRWAWHRQHGWRRMEVLYKSSSRDHVCELERRLVERLHLDVALGGQHHNARAGGGGRIPASGPYFVYLISAAPWTRMYRRSA